MTPGILVVFSSRTGDTEKLALAAAVGAVQARARIRLRRLPHADDEGPEMPEALRRMQREYIAPQVADLDWADAIVFCPSSGLDQEWVGFLELLGGMSRKRTSGGRLAAVVGKDHPHATAGLSDAVSSFGFTVHPPARDRLPETSDVDGARVEGLRLAIRVRDLRAEKS